MSENTLKFNNARVNKKELHKSKQPINLGLVIVNKIVVSDKFRHSDKGFKYLLVTKKMKLLSRFALSYLK